MTHYKLDANWYIRDCVDNFVICADGRELTVNKQIDRVSAVIDSSANKAVIVCIIIEGRMHVAKIPWNVNEKIRFN